MFDENGNVACPTCTVLSRPSVVSSVGLLTGVPTIPWAAVRLIVEDVRDNGRSATLMAMDTPALTHVTKLRLLLVQMLERGLRAININGSVNVTFASPGVGPRLATEVESFARNRTGAVASVLVLTAGTAAHMSTFHVPATLAIYASSVRGRARHAVHGRGGGRF